MESHVFFSVYHCRTDMPESALLIRGFDSLEESMDFLKLCGWEKTFCRGNHMPCNLYETELDGITFMRIVDNTNYN